ncbi:MAG: hypothetical protein OXJ55_07180 [Caldilineaceae bacterium]|nr:hypothetical protein [Caldilineaceae bacterium]MDE0462914.1 hypothetical protein [Caldilineaceae bacterium]
MDQLIDLEEAPRLSTIPFLVEARLAETFHREIERDCCILVLGSQI